jgi:hypothetical protein
LSLELQVILRQPFLEDCIASSDSAHNIVVLELHGGLLGAYQVDVLGDGDDRHQDAVLVNKSLHLPLQLVIVPLLWHEGDRSHLEYLLALQVQLLIVYFGNVHNALSEVLIVNILIFP